jgi:nickel transport protein
MKSFTIITAWIAFQLLWPTAGWSHGVRGGVVRSDGYLVTAEYDDGEPMSYAAVEIKSPDSNIAFQTGRTDRNGLFMFRPDREGRWRIVVQDNMGHRLAVHPEVAGDTADAKAADAESRVTSSDLTRAGKAVMGLSIIFGVFGLWYGWRARRAIRRAPS